MQCIYLIVSDKVKTMTNITPPHLCRNIKKQRNHQAFRDKEALDWVTTTKTKKKNIKEKFLIIRKNKSFENDGFSPNASLFCDFNIRNVIRKCKKEVIFLCFLMIGSRPTFNGLNKCNLGNTMYGSIIRNMNTNYINAMD